MVDGFVGVVANWECCVSERSRLFLIFLVIDSAQEQTADTHSRADSSMLRSLLCDDVNVIRGNNNIIWNTSSSRRERSGNQ